MNRYIWAETFHGAPSSQFGTAQLVFIDRDLANDDTMGFILLSQEDIRTGHLGGQFKGG
ncbi:MAG: hypothetical protein R3E66_03515 [bacterium]